MFFTVTIQNVHVDNITSTSNSNVYICNVIKFIWQHIDIVFEIGFINVY